MTENVYVTGVITPYYGVITCYNLILIIGDFVPTLQLGWFKHQPVLVETRVFVGTFQSDLRFDEKVEPDVAKEMFMGQSSKIFSAFHLGYLDLFLCPRDPITF